jgi:hypothetical protein
VPFPLTLSALRSGDLDVSASLRIGGPRLVWPEVGDLGEAVPMQQPPISPGRKRLTNGSPISAAIPAKAAAICPVVPCSAAGGRS